MKLQVKFLGIMAILGLAVGVNVATAWWAVRTLERELAWPLDSMQRVLDGLHAAQRGVERQAAAVGLLRGARGQIRLPAEPDPAAPTLDFGAGETNLPGVFAAGDIVRGASLVVWALKDGLNAAEQIHLRLRAKAGQRAGGAAIVAAE